MAKQRKRSATIIPFPTHLTKLPRSNSTYGLKVPTARGSIELYAGDSGMVLIDARVPTALAARMLEAVGRSVP